MKNKPSIFFQLAIIIGAVALFIILQTALAQEELDITFPVAELGNCKDETSCKTYCDKPENAGPCLDFAERYDLMPQSEIERARKVIGKTGPGGCRARQCETFCNDIKNIDACLAFAEENGLMPPEELEEAQKVQAALKQGAKLPGNCKNKDECDRYCKSPQSAEQMEECINFAERAGFIPPGELEKARTALRVMKETGLKPPPCRGDHECMEYCSESEERLLNECLPFAEAAGFISPGEVKMIKATKGRGPGGCVGEACKHFCEDEANQEACANFMTELLEKNPDLNIEDIIPEEDRARMQEGLGQMQDALDQAPEEVRICIEEKFPGIVQKIESGNFSPRDMMAVGPRMGNAMRGCFEKNMPAPPAEVQECFTELGVDFKKMKGPPGPELMSQIEECMANKFGGEGGFPGGPDGQGFGGGAIPDGAFATEGPNGITVMMKNSNGIQEFSILPSGGSPYGGGLSNCPKEHKAETPFGESSFPFQVVITDCDGEQHEFTLDSVGGPPSGGPPGGSEMPPGMEECFTEIGLPFPPRRPPSAEEQQRLGACMRSKFGGGPGEDEHEGPPSGFPGEPGEFPGGAPGGFPGGPGGASPEMMECFAREGWNRQGPPSQEIIQACVGEFGPSDQGFGPPDGFPPDFEPGEGFIPSEGEEGSPPTFGPPQGLTPEQLQQQFPSGQPTQEQIQQYQQQYQQQFQEQFQQQYQQQYQQQCIAQGGVWDGANCQPPQGAPGGPPGGGTDPATQCVQGGGTWNGTTCQFGGGGFLYQPSPQARFNPPSLLGFFAQILLGIR